MLTGHSLSLRMMLWQMSRVSTKLCKHINPNSLFWRRRHPLSKWGELNYSGPFSTFSSLSSPNQCDSKTTSEFNFDFPFLLEHIHNHMRRPSVSSIENWKQETCYKQDVPRMGHSSGYLSHSPVHHWCVQHLWPDCWPLQSPQFQQTQLLVFPGV